MWSAPSVTKTVIIKKIKGYGGAQSLVIPETNDSDSDYSVQQVKGSFLYIK